MTTQGLNSILLYCLVSRLHRKSALATAILFAILPSTAFAVGWVAADYDLFYVMFSLAFLNAGMAFWRGRSPVFAAFAMIALVSALGCKEPAVTMVAALPLLALWDVKQRDNLRAGALCAATFAAALIYIFLRFPALAGLSATGAGGYGFGGASKILWNVIADFGFPFAVKFSEMSGYTDSSPRYLALTNGAHILLMAAIWMRWGWRASATYLVGYFLTAAPTLIISKHETQYLYGSGMALSLGLVAICDSSALRALLFTGLTGLMVWHGFAIQRTAYETGACQTRLLVSLDALLPTLRPTAPVSVYGSDAAPWWVLARALHQNDFSVDGKEVVVTFTNHPVGAGLRLEPNCTIVAAIN